MKSLSSVNVYSGINLAVKRKSFDDLRLVYTERQRQLCDDASKTGLIENNAVTLEWVPNRVASIIAEMSQY